MIDYRYFTIEISTTESCLTFSPKQGIFSPKQGTFSEKQRTYSSKQETFSPKQGTLSSKQWTFSEKQGTFSEKPLDYLTGQKSLSPTTEKWMFHDVAIPPINPRSLICPSFFFRKFAGREQDAHTTFFQDQHKWN